MKYTMNFGPWSTVFAVPSHIVDDHMKMCGAAQLKVLLLLLRHANNPMELSELAAVLSLSPGDTQDALNYWITAGVLLAHPTEAGAELTAGSSKKPALTATAKQVPVNDTNEPIEKHTKPQREVLAEGEKSLKQGGNTPQNTTEQQNAAYSQNASELQATTQFKSFDEQQSSGYLQDSVGAQSTTMPQNATEPKPQRAKLSSAEITEMTNRSGELKSLLSETEASLGKTLSSADISTLASLYDWAGIPVDVLLTVMEYCKQKGKTNLRYVEKVALGWQEKGIDTFEKAERYIKQTLEGDAQESLCKSAFGIYDRRLTSKETEFVKSWFNDYKFDIAIIKLAYERSVEHTGKVSFPYINKILTNWHEQHIKTPEEATREEKAFSRKKDENKPKSSYDIDEFEEYLLRNAQNG